MTRRRLRRLAAFVSLALIATGAVVGATAAAATPTVVSLTFDDGQATHLAAMQALRAREMVGTFYINSGQVGSSPYYLPWAPIHEIADAGNEIGGHTSHHVNLTQVSAATARAEVCDDRAALVAQGFSPSAFAYPEAGVNPTVEQIVRDCGYGSGRDVGSLFGPQCPCPYTEAVPPPDPYRLRTIDGATTATTLADLQAAVTGAETHGGGWVPLVFHGICDNQCTGGNSVSTQTFTAFLDWLAARSGQGTVVRTVGQVLGTTSPPTSPSTTTTSATTTIAPVTTTAPPSTTIAPVTTTTPPSTSTTTTTTSGVIPTTTIRCGGAACTTGWYRTPVQIAFTTSPAGAVTRYTTDGSDPTTSATTQTYTAPFDLPATATVRYRSSSNGFVTAETLRATPLRIDAAAPTVTLTSPTAGTSVARGANVTLRATAADAGTPPGTASGLTQVAFLLDGATQPVATDPTSPYQVTWRAPQNLALGTHTLTAVATDAAGNRTTSAGVGITVRR